MFKTHKVLKIVSITILTLILLAVVYFWTEIRPRLVTEECLKIANSQAAKASNYYPNKAYSASDKDALAREKVFVHKSGELFVACLREQKILR